MNKKSRMYDPSFFRVCYIAVLFFTNLTFIQIPAYLALVFMFFWGVRLAIYKIRVQHCLKRLRFSIWLIAFMAANVVAMLIFFTWGIIYSIIMLLHMSICFFIFYGIHTEEGLNPKAELYKVCRFIIYATSIAGIIGFILMMCHVKFELNWDNIFIIKFIIFENRFTGIYMNPNMLGFVSVVSIVCCHIISKHDFLAQAKKPRISRIVLAVWLCVNLFSLLLCDSNASFVLLICYVIFTIVFYFFSNPARLTLKQILTKSLALLLACVYIVGAAFLTRMVCQKTFSTLLTTTKLSDEAIESKEEITFEHENKNADSGRLKLIKESVGLFKISPVFGIGNGNIILFSQQNLSGTLAFNYHNHDLHNGYLTILVSSGVLGFCLFAVFGFRFTKHTVSNLFKRQKADSQDILPCLFAFCCGYLIYSLFEKALLFDISFMVMWFWYMIGMTGVYLNKYEPMETGYYNFKKHRIPKHMI
ncbi:MAG: O-antigen ligase family protein [Ruminococcus sp.]|nr:O-antigen ligase family protein [Ruminococcus sp.]